MNVSDLLPDNWQLKGLGIDVFDKKLLAFYQAVLEKFPTAYVNVSNGKRMHNWCGYRTADCPIGAANSAHKLGKALDMHLPGAYAQNKLLYDWCIDNGAKYGIARMEDEAVTLANRDGGWVHADTVGLTPAQKSRASQLKKGIYVFKP
jgi:hypothetical protein